jgi:uncharacterized membrane protein
MDWDGFWRLVHVVSDAFFGGGLLAMVFVQSLLQRSNDDAERKHLARAIHQAARLFVGPSGIVAFVSGFGVLLTRYSFGGLGKVMACAPVYVHLMLAFGLLAIGLGHAWAANLRKLSAALDAGTPFADARRHLQKAWIFVLLAAFFVLAAFTVALLRVPNPPRSGCMAGTFDAAVSMIG